MKTTLQGLAPIIEKDARILILGSMPSPVSLAKQEYYGHPQNRFWKILQDLFGGGACRDYTARKKILTGHGLALWDVLGACEREGALDSRIRNGVPNDISGLLRAHPGVRRIILNGRYAEKCWRRYFADKVNLRADYAPSTSPAHAGMNYQGKLKVWGRLLGAI